MSSLLLISFHKKLQTQIINTKELQKHFHTKSIFIKFPFTKNTSADYLYRKASKTFSYKTAAYKIVQLTPNV
jgi:hypothetical protein